MKTSRTSHNCIFEQVYERKKEKKKEMFYLTTKTTHFIYGYMASNVNEAILLGTTLSPFKVRC